MWKLIGIILAACISAPLMAHEIANDITQLNPIAVEKIVAPTQLTEIQQIVANHAGSISIGGGRYSQGGQTACTGCLFLDLRQFNQILHLDVEKRLITVQPGVTWRQIEEAVDPYNLSPMIMQSYHNFTVGGSISVNVHGPYVGDGPMVESIRSIKMVLADGSLVTANREENKELFYGAVGGYGGLGVIVEATLELTDNPKLERMPRPMLVEDYKKYFYANIPGSKTANLHHATLYPPDYRRMNVITASVTDKPLTVPERLDRKTQPSWLDLQMLNFVKDYDAGKWFREYVYDRFHKAKSEVVWRNYEISQDVAAMEPLSRQSSTYVLQEYFVPPEHFDEFTDRLRDILMSYHVNALNVSIRHSEADPNTLLAWARHEVFAFVMYYAQGTSDAEREATRVWTGELIDAVLSAGGSYYLPYQIIASKDQFLKAYPRAPEYFALKRRVDPGNKFHNKLWDAYYTPD